MGNIYELYSEVVKYAQHLEKALQQHSNIDDENMKAIRDCYIKSDVRDWEEKR